MKWLLYNQLMEQVVFFTPFIFIIIFLILSFKISYRRRFIPGLSLLLLTFISFICIAPFAYQEGIAYIIVFYVLLLFFGGILILVAVLFRKQNK
ncbi:hypothetical protein QUF88_22945 [Bacillus sp. DX1.1]|uniref:hypothetical protein n=1 Tax=unclassified Bacillus (in: firmicutes) TaxID=185979 RepID=UPI002570ADA5|nr:MULTISPECIES: hypothetical protein [unclassified Bacillus (in: firmicutes)]MDM5156572.1 hypothetical protein [Bacillus sp. DX1.1]WJE80834.1 hypothetical protein QRE67_20485 [Bacillus sp. DX3.1]